MRKTAIAALSLTLAIIASPALAGEDFYGIAPVRAHAIEKANARAFNHAIGKKSCYHPATADSCTHDGPAGSYRCIANAANDPASCPETLKRSANPASWEY